MLTREQAFDAAGEDPFDALIVGGGVSGAAVFRELAQRGKRVLLVDRSDFAAGTSQASGMLVWGGLLYLKNFDIRTVLKLSAERDRMLLAEPKDVRTLRFRYLPLRSGGRSPLLVRAVLYAYWLLGQRRRQRPHGESDFVCRDLLQADRFGTSLVYQEAGLTSSDSRFALGWLLGQEGDVQVPINHCELLCGRWDRSQSMWSVELEDRVGGQRVCARARTLINAGGVWADQVNELCGIKSDHRHVFSKGVYLVFKRPDDLDEALVFEMGEHGDTQTFTPWGPVALWGPTETSIERVEQGLSPNVEDVRFLLQHANRNLRTQRGPEDIISLRCGVRPLAVKRSYRAKQYPLELSRHHVVSRDKNSAALTLYGGKITSAPAMAREAAGMLEQYLTTSNSPRKQEQRLRPQAPLTLEFPGLEAPLPDPAWSRENEYSATLQDYLRRRTNLSQWIPRLGLGINNEHADLIMGIAKAIHLDPNGSEATVPKARKAVAALRQAADKQDRLLAAC